MVHKARFVEDGAATADVCVRGLVGSNRNIGLPHKQKIAVTKNRVREKKIREECRRFFGREFWA